MALLKMEQERERKSMASILGELLEGIFFSVATGKLTDESRDKVAQSLRKRTLALLYPELVVDEAKAQADEVARAAGLAEMVQLLGKKGSFSSMEQLQGALNALKQTLAENSA